MTAFSVLMVLGCPTPTTRIEWISLLNEWIYTLNKQLIEVLNLINAIKAPQIIGSLYFTLENSKILFRERLSTKIVFAWDYIELWKLNKKRTKGSCTYSYAINQKIFQNLNKKRDMHCQCKLVLHRQPMTNKYF